MAWLQAKDELAAAEARELELRKLILEKAFPDIEAGTNNLALSAGWLLKAVQRLYHKLDPKLTPPALKKLEAEGEVGQLLAGRLIKWKPDLVVTEYKALSGKQRGYFVKALTISPGQASLELVPPKG